MSGSRAIHHIALAMLTALMIVSLALAMVAPPSLVARAIPPGVVLAVAKIVALAFVFARVRSANVYSMQWSSMFILFFVAEGAVRAGSDPQSSAMLGLIEALCAAGYFAAVLAILWPLKRAAKQSERPSVKHSIERSDE